MSQCVESPSEVGREEESSLQRKRRKKSSRSHEPLNLYVCAYYDELLTPVDEEERRKRAHLAFSWGLMVKRDALEARGLRFRLSAADSDHQTRQRKEVEPFWRPRECRPKTRTRM